MTQNASGSNRVTAPVPPHGTDRDTIGRDTLGRDTVGRDTIGHDTLGHDASQPLRLHHERHTEHHTEPVRTTSATHVAPAARPAAVLDGPSHEVRPARPAKTSTAAVFALVFGLAALFCALTGLLSPVALLLGLIGLVLGFVGLKMARRPGVTGRGVALGGLVTSVLGLLLGGVVLAGITAVVNDSSQLDRIQGWVDDRRAELPSTTQLREDLPGSS